MDMTASVASDHLTWDQVEAVTLTRFQRRPYVVDNDPFLDKGPVTPPFDPYANVLPTQLTQAVPVAKRRALTTRERMASGGAYTGGDINWHLPAAVLPVGFLVEPGDQIGDAAGTTWTVLDVALNRLRNTWKCTSRDLVLAANLRDSIDIERPEIRYDAAGAAVKAFPTGPQPLGGEVLYAALAARVVPKHMANADERGMRGPRTEFDIVVARDVWVTPEYRVRWDGLYLEITGYRQAERIDELPVLECALAP